MVTDGQPAARLLPRLAHELIDVLYPPRCLLCGAGAAAAVAPVDTCRDHRLPERGAVPRCGRCTARLPPAVPDGEECVGCARGARFPGVVVSLGDYADPALREWVLALKHGGRRDLGRPLGLLLARELTRVLGQRPAGGGVRALAAAAVVPVPLHPLRRFERGFDQARCLAAGVAEGLEAELVTRLRRLRPTPPQGSPGVASRAANLRGAFQWREPLRVGGRPVARWPWAPRRRGTAVGDVGARDGPAAGGARGDVVLVDDVLTSGSTLREAARAVRRAGLRPLAVAVVARASAGGRRGPAE